MKGRCWVRGTFGKDRRAAEWMEPRAVRKWQETSIGRDQYW